MPLHCLCLVLPFFFLTIDSVDATTFTINNNCSYTMWPAMLTGSGAPLSTTGFELVPGASNAVNVVSPWSGRVWGRTLCATDASGKFACQTGDCGSGMVECNGAGGAPPASLAELTIAPDNGHQDFFDISLVDGFNVPMSLTPQGGCQSVTCSGDVNSVCPPELSLKGTDGATIGCKSACVVFNRPDYCCTGQFGTSDTCPPSSYAKIFKQQCPQAYSYAYDDKTSTFTCTGGVNYLVTFCP